MKILQANPLAETMELRGDISAAINRVLDSGLYIQGPEVAAFEQEFAEYIGTSYAIGVASGTDAIRLGLCALGVVSGDEVITVSHTAVATVAAIEQCGATAVLVDIDPQTYTMDPEKLEKAVSARTRAIIPVHLYGHPANLDRILDFAKNRGIHVLEDCAQAHGARYHSSRVGTWGKLASFSFYPTKNLGALGDGGMVVTNDEDIAKKIRLLREYGWKNRYVSEISGFNSRLDELQAAVLRAKLRYLDRHNTRRRELAQIYTNRLSEKVVTPIEETGSFHVYHLYVIRSSQRDALRVLLAENGIGTGIHYPFPVHLQPAYTHLGYKAGSLVVTEQVAREILSLPLYPQLEMKQIEEISDFISEFIDADA